MYAYTITNKKNNRIYWGRTTNPNFKEDFIDILEKGVHYNLLLQKDYEPDVYEWKIDKEFDKGEEEDLSNYVIQQIRNDMSHRALTGYNIYSDQNRKSRTAHFDCFDEDVLVPYVSGRMAAVDIRESLGITRNVLEYRLKRNGLHPREKISLSNYDIFFAFAERTVALESPRAIKADNILDKMQKRYYISNRLRVTPPKIAKKLRGFGIPIMKKNNYGHFYMPFDDAYIPEHIIT